MSEILEKKRKEFEDMKALGHITKEFPEFEFDNKKDRFGFSLSLENCTLEKIKVFVWVEEDRTYYLVTIMNINTYLRTEMTLNKEDTRKLLTTLISLNFLN